MPLYDITAVAHAVDLDSKQLDNLLSRNTLPGVQKRRRGLARRFTPEVAVVVRLASDIGTALNLPTGRLLMLAYETDRADRREVSIGEFAKLQIDLDTLRASTFARLDEAVEVIGRRPRGRRPAPRRA